MFSLAAQEATWLFKLLNELRKCAKETNRECKISSHDTLILTSEDESVNDVPSTFVPVNTETDTPTAEAIDSGPHFQ